MWKYLKDYVIGKLLDKWIIKQNISNDPSNSEAFIHYQNIELNTNSFNDSILKNLNFSLNTGSVEDLNVTINWKEIFRYWTEIRAKYHIETDAEDEDEEDETENDFENAENSLIRIKGLVLNLNFNSSHNDSDCLIDEPVIGTTDVDLMKDFLNHIIGQFKLEIEDIKLILNENFVIKILNITILPEINGLRRINIPEDTTYENLDVNKVGGRILKGTEILIMRTIEGDVIKIKIPGIEIEATDLNSLIILINSFKSETEDGDTKKTNTNVNVSIDTFKLSINPLTLFLHDIWIDSSGSFILGHFNLKLKDYSIIASPIQTHVVTGNFKNNRIMIEEEIIIRLRDMKQIEDIKQLLAYERTENNKDFDTNNTVDFQVNMKSVVLVIDDFNVKVLDVTLLDNLVSIGNAGICYHSSKLSISNIKYKMQMESNTISLAVSPFAELKRFIENDEILSIEDEVILYENFKGLINNLEIRCITGSIELDDMKCLTSMMSNDTSNGKNPLMGTVDKVEIVLKPSDDTVYATHLSSISFLKAEGFVDLRTHLDCFKRNDQILMNSGNLVVVKTDDILVSNLENLNLLIPYNLHESLTDDVKILKLILPSKASSVKQNDFQLSFKNTKIKLGTPDDFKEPVESEFIIKEINCKFDVLYVDEVIMKLNKEIILNSGLLKIHYDGLKSIEVHNYCSNVCLDRVAYQNLIKFASFWSEIYSPDIEEIKPEAVFHDESSFNEEEEEAEEEETEGISGVLMQFEGEGTEDFELELELDVSEDISNEPSSDNGSVPSDDNLMELLKDIDEEFFINKQKEIIDDSFMKISNFGMKINLILSSDSSQKDLTISLNGIDGTISSEKISLKCKEGSIHKNSKTILHRWPRGPDVTCKYPIEDGNFVTIKAEKLEIKNDAGIDEFNLIISVCPLRLFLDQKSLNDLATFFKDEQVKIQSSGKLKSFIFFNKVNISPLALKIDYNPNSTSLSAPIPLQGAEMILPRVELRGVKGFEGLGPAVFSAWIPELKGKKLTGVLTTGLVPVRTIVNLGGGVVELILLPWQLGPEQSAAQTVAQIRKNGKRIGLETLKLTASLANRTSKLLSIEQPSTTSYPSDFQSGVQQAAQLIIALPTRVSQSKKGALRAVPLIVLDSAATATGALAKTLQGIQAEFDKEVDYERKIKRK